jgi:hypothetical protein
MNQTLFIDTANTVESSKIEVTSPCRGKTISVFMQVISKVQPPIQWVQATLSPGVKWPEREADQSLPSSAEVSNDGAIHPLPIRLHVIMLNYLSTGTILTFMCLKAHFSRLIHHRAVRRCVTSTTVTASLNTPRMKPCIRN